MTRNEVKQASRYYRSTRSRIANINPHKTAFAYQRIDEMQAEPMYELGARFAPRVDSLLTAKRRRAERLATIRRDRERAAIRTEIDAKIEARRARYRNGTASLFDRIECELELRNGTFAL